MYTMRFEEFVIPKLFDSLGLASNTKLFGEAQVLQRSLSYIKRVTRAGRAQYLDYVIIPECLNIKTAVDS